MKPSGEECVNEFTIIKGTGKPLLGRNNAKKLKLLRVGPVSEPQFVLWRQKGVMKVFGNNMQTYLLDWKVEELSAKTTHQ